MSSPLFVPELLAVAPSALAAALSQTTYDAAVVVGLGPLSSAVPPGPLAEALAQSEKVDASIHADRASVVFIPAREAPGGRLVGASTGGLKSWEMDVRAYATAAAAGLARAIAAGAKRPLLIVGGVDGDARYARALEVAVLGALAAMWEPLEVRGESHVPRVERLGVCIDGDASAMLSLVATLERGRIVARDICGTEPESMAAEGMARYCESAFRGTGVAVEVIRDRAAIDTGFPLIGAVARASYAVPRHHPRVIRLTYEGAGPIERTIFLAGKGVTYDTGGADLKTDGHMAGMSRDKGGAAAIAGLLHVLAERKPRGVRVVGLLGAVRNSIGSDAFVTDEIFRSRAGVRVRIGNTDAEGRLVLADLLAALREEAEKSPRPAVFSIATLTGHAALAHGPFTSLMENGAARDMKLAASLLAAGEALGDGIELSPLHAEDYAFIAGKSAAEDVLSCNNAASARTPRGHQFPTAFLEVVSGLRASKTPIAYMHVDIAGSAVANGSWQTGTPTGAPVLALAQGLSLV